MKYKIILFFAVLIFFLYSITCSNVYAFIDEEMILICPKQKIIKMYDGDVFSQTFISKVDKFSYVFVKFSNFNTVSDDVILFRIKESDSDSWYSSGEYKLDKFKNDNFYRFAFIPIINAKGKQYIFELGIKSGEDKIPLGIYLSEEDCRENADVYLNNQNIGGDIIFNVGIGESAKQRFIGDIEAKIDSDFPFFTIWVMLIFTTIIIFIKREIV